MKTLKLLNYAADRWVGGRRRLAAGEERRHRRGDRRDRQRRARFRGDARSRPHRSAGRRCGKLTFHERAWMLKDLANAVMARKEELYELSYATGATRDRRLDRHRGRRRHALLLLLQGPARAAQRPGADRRRDGAAVDAAAASSASTSTRRSRASRSISTRSTSRSGGCSRSSGRPCSPGVPAIVKPASATGYLTEACVRIMIEADVLPKGALQLIMGSIGDLIDHLTLQDVVSFTGSAATAMKLQIASGDRARERPLRRRARQPQRLDPRARRGAGHAGIRPVRQGGGARDDGQGGPEMHRHPPRHGARPSISTRSQEALSARLAKVQDRRPARRGDARWARSPAATQLESVREAVAELAKVGADRLAAIPDASPVRGRRRLHLADPAALRRSLGRRRRSTTSRRSGRFRRSCRIAISTTRSRSPIAAWAASRCRCSPSTRRSPRSSCSAPAPITAGW